MQSIIIMLSIYILYSIALSSWLSQTKDINFTMEKKMVRERNYRPP